MESPLLSVCLITYNHASYIRQAIDSVMMQQTGFTWELIIADDFSTDGTREILLEYKKKHPDTIKLILQEKNVGPGKNWLDLITSPKAKYVAYFEGDDYWTDDRKLQKQVDFLEANSDYAFCAHRVLYQFGKRKKRGYHWDAPTDTDLQYLLRKGNFFSTHSVVYRNHPDIPEFLLKFHAAPFQDYVLYIAAACYGRIKILDDTMGVYRVHKGGIWSQSGFQKVFDKLLQVIELLLAHLPEKHHDDLRIHVLRIIEQRLWIDNSFELKDNERLNTLLEKLNIPHYATEYIRFNNGERTNPSFYSKHVPASLLYSALRQKLKNRF